MFNFIEETVAKIGSFAGYDGEPAVVFLPNRGLYVECKNQIVSYSDSSVSFKTKHGIIVVEGQNIKISCLDKESFFLSGKMVKVEVH